MLLLHLGKLILGQNMDFWNRVIGVRKPLGHKNLRLLCKKAQCIDQKPKLDRKMCRDSIQAVPTSLNITLQWLSKIMYQYHTRRKIRESSIFFIRSKSHCLKITQNVAFEFFNFGIFHQFFCPIKIDLSANTVWPVWPQDSGFKKLAKMDHFWHF